MRQEGMACRPMIRLACPVRGDQQEVRGPLPVRGQERRLDPGAVYRVRAQLPVRDGVGGEVRDGVRHQAVRGQGGEVRAAPVHRAAVVRVDPLSVHSGPDRIVDAPGDAGRAAIISLSWVTASTGSGVANCVPSDENIVSLKCQYACQFLST